MPPAKLATDLRGRRRPVVEVGEGHAEDRLAEGALDPAKVALVFRGHEGDRLAFRLHAGRSPDAVHVILGAVGTS